MNNKFLYSLKFFSIKIQVFSKLNTLYRRAW